MNKRGMSIFSLIILLTALTVGMFVVTMDEAGVDFDIDTIKNVTVWNDINITEGALHPELKTALQDYINGLGSAYMAIARWVEEYAYNNPEIPYKLLFTLVIISLFIPIIVGLTKFLVIIFLLIKESIQSRREKKRLKSYKGGQEK